MCSSCTRDPLVRRTKRVSFMALQSGELCFDVVVDGPFTCSFPWEEMGKVFLSASLAKFFLKIAAVQQ